MEQPLICGRGKVTRGHLQALSGGTTGVTSQSGIYPQADQTATSVYAELKFHGRRYSNPPVCLDIGRYMRTEAMEILYLGILHGTSS